MRIDEHRIVLNFFLLNRIICFEFVKLILLISLACTRTCNEPAVWIYHELARTALNVNDLLYNYNNLS